MRIIKNLIIKNRLKKQLANIETQLTENGYYEYERDLSMMFCAPDDYAMLYEYIKTKFGSMLAEKNNICRQLTLLSGTNLFTAKMDDCASFEK